MLYTIVSAHACLLNSKQIIACDQNMDNILDINPNINNDSSQVMSPCEGYYYCINTTYCLDRNSYDINFTCKRINDTYICQCTNGTSCLYEFDIACVKISSKNKATDSITYRINVFNSKCQPYYGLYYRTHECCLEKVGCNQLLIDPTNKKINHSFINLSSIKLMYPNSVVCSGFRCELRQPSRNIHMDLSEMGRIKLLPYLLGQHRLFSSLNLSGNDIRYVVRKSFSKSRIQQIDLSSSNITVIGYSSFKTSEVSWIDLAGNMIKLIVGSFSYCERLPYVNLSSQAIEIVEQYSFTHLLSIQIIDLSYNYITNIVDHTFSSGFSLKFLNLSNNCIKSIAYDAISRYYKAVSELIPNIDLTNQCSRPVGKLILRQNSSLQNIDFSELSRDNISNILAEHYEPVMSENANRINVAESSNCIDMVDISNTRGIIHDVINIIHSTGSTFFSNIRKNSKILKPLWRQQLRAISFYRFVVPSKLNKSVSSINIIEETAYFTDLNISTLNLSRHCITSIPFLKDIKNIELIDFSANYIKRILESSFNEEENDYYLTHLDLAGNCVEVIETYAFRNIFKIPLLNLSHQCIHNLEVYAIYNCLFKIIDLSYNSLTFIERSPFGKVFNLSTLQLNKNKILFIEKILDDSIALIPIAFVDFSHNAIWSLGQFMNEVSRYTSLVYLNVSYNQLMYLSSEVFNALINLERLILVGNRFKTVHPRPFAGLKNLHYLNLSNSSVDMLPKETFSGLSNVKIIDLSHNTLKSIESGAFVGIENMTHLDISDNQLIQVSESLLQNMLINTVVTDEFRFCCALNRSEFNYIKTCYPLPNQFSSCDDLMANLLLQILIWVVGIASLVGNTFVIIWRLRGNLSRVTDLLILHLSLSDILMGVYLCIIASFDTYYRGNYYQHAGDWVNGFVCKLAGVLNLLSSEVSVFLLLIISIDRFLVIVFTFKSINFDFNQAKRITIVGWLSILSLCLIPLLYETYFPRFYTSSGVCMAFSIGYMHGVSGITQETLTIGYYFIDAILIFNFVAFITILILYCSVYYKVRSVSQETLKIRTTKKTNTEITIARKLVFILVTDFLCWIPIIMIKFISRISGITMPADVSAWLAIFVLPLNSALNPFLFTLSATNFMKNIHG